MFWWTSWKFYLNLGQEIVLHGCETVIFLGQMSLKTERRDKLFNIILRRSQYNSVDEIVSVNQHPKINIHKTHCNTPQFSFYGLALCKQNPRKKGKEREQQLDSLCGKERNKVGSLLMLYRKVQNLIGMGKKPKQKNPWLLNTPK